MSLAPGTRLGPYEVVAPLGAGGMGEVYKATDTRLGRNVAIKVLPEHVASDEALKARFEREARALSSLNHPHICTIHDVGSQGSTNFLVMEHLDGETLADRLARGPLPLAEAIGHAVAIADALDKAHRKGIVHRDLKPGNIMLTKAGAGSAGSPQAKLLDFGLAKVVGPVKAGHYPPGPAEAGHYVPDVSAAQTIASPLTGTGSIVGTFQYMPPEQLEGREADTRSDVFAFGAVLYEMVTGKRAFEGRSQASLIHAIMGTEPRPVSAVQPLAPRALDHVIDRCLAKAPDDRWQTARDVHQELRWVLERSLAAPETAPATPATSDRSWRTVMSVAVPSLVLGAAVAAIAFRMTTKPEPPVAISRLQAARTPATSIGNPRLPQIAVSPDGRTIAFAGQSPDGRLGIFVRPLDGAEARLVNTSGTSAFGPVFSPDGKWIAYRSLEELFKVPVGGGRPTTLGRLESVFISQGMSWSSDDWIYFSEATSQSTGTLFRMRASGGQREPLTSSTEDALLWPHVTVDGRFVIFTESGLTNRLKVLDTQTKETRVLLDDGGSMPSVTASGHLLFVKEGSLFAVVLDTSRMAVVGTPREVLSGLQYEGASTTAQFAIARNGTLVYQGGATAGTSLLWADARGAIQAFPQERVYYDPRLSPDGRSVAGEVQEDGDDIWVLDLIRGTETKLSLGPNEDETPAWSPDGRWVAWSASRDAGRVILRKRADGSGAEEVLWSGPEHVHVIAYTPSGDLLFEKQTPGQNTDVWLLPTGGSGKDRLVLGTRFNEVGARVSPDGRWLVYMSDETGIPQIYVQPFPALDARFSISSSGGAEPVWSRDGRRLFYRVNSALWSVSIAPGAAFQAGIPERLFEGPYQNKAVTHTGYDVGPDGRFLVVGDRSPQAEVLTVIQGWFEELNRLVPTQ